MTLRSPSVVRLLVAALTLFALALPIPTAAQGAREPARGTPERVALMDAVRPLVEVRVGGPVEFVVVRLQVAGDWAFAILDPQHPGGARIDPARTIYGEDSEYMDGLRTYALLVNANGRWNIVDYAVGPTDAFWDGNPLYRNIPRGLLP
ncbi:hypothetical protein [Stappia sp. WLB 29]|uniref:hypothetical protein n=1 Tax=Stappia sp. WLB 29 TaxID=2925220 RepID=UPI0020C01E56|nr:hypothetical protein [Stappia sp. WLB 29]